MAKALRPEQMLHAGQFRSLADIRMTYGITRIQLAPPPQYARPSPAGNRPSAGGNLSQSRRSKSQKGLCEAGQGRNEPRQTKGSTGGAT